VFDFLKKHAESRTKLFEHPEDAEIHVALASLLYHALSVDSTESKKEKQVFATILKDQFGLNGHQVGELYAHVKNANTNIASDLDVIEKHLKHNPYLRMLFMQKLMQLIDVAGLKPAEMDIFYLAQNKLFPDLAAKDEDFD
jgi:uncharacterized tellurite resistance protein B-like protein